MLETRIFFFPLLASPPSHRMSIFNSSAPIQPSPFAPRTGLFHPVAANPFGTHKRQPTSRLVFPPNTTTLNTRKRSRESDADDEIGEDDELDAEESFAEEIEADEDEESEGDEMEGEESEKGGEEDEDESGADVSAENDDDVSEVAIDDEEEGADEEGEAANVSSRQCGIGQPQPSTIALGPPRLVEEVAEGDEPLPQDSITKLRLLSTFVDLPPGVRGNASLSSSVGEKFRRVLPTADLDLQLAQVLNA